ncbi:hypothetical protein JRQ81_005897, partial [Phrynocephalus forsythii]
PRGDEEHNREDTKKGKRSKVEKVDKTFDNWLSGFVEFAGVVEMVYLERGWHLNNHLRNVLKARQLAGDQAALDYDTAFRKRASQSAEARWDLINQPLWLVEVGPYMKGKGDRNKPLRWGGKDSSKRLCWEYNAGKCVHAKCKLDHNCDQCLGPHPRVACTSQRGAQGSFHGATPPSKPNISKDSGSGAAAGAAPVRR